MAICPAGHETGQTDFCDVCGLPMDGSQQQPSAEPVAAATTINCPNCSTPNVAEALFCEACGYDFTTGVAPGPAHPTAVDSPSPSGADADAEAEATDRAGVSDPEVTNAEPVAPAEASAAPEPAAPTDVPAPAAAATRPVVEWVAELWIDPDWYAAQGSTDPMPSAGLPDIVPLVKESNLIGRVSHSRGIFPAVDCELDNGCSRRHAMLSTDGTRWWIEDLNSANGTFVGAATGMLPAMPIPQGRVELNPGQRIYVGAWTRIVIRKATDDELEAFAG